MSTHPLVEQFRSGQVPAQLKTAAARGALPIPPEDLLHVLFHLRGEKDLQRDIVSTIQGLPEDTLLGVAASQETPPAMLDFLARASVQREEVLEKILLNPATADATFLVLAKHGSSSILELMMLNQVRLTRTPSIIQAILDNERVTLSIRRRLKEVWDLHQAEQAERSRRAEAAPEEPEPPAEAAAEASPEPAEAKDEAESAGAEAKDEAGSASGDAAEAGTGQDLEDIEGLEDLEDAASGFDEKLLAELEEEGASEEDLKLAQRVLTMSVADKIQLALKGDRGARSLLIRDASKLVQESVVKSPKITEDEIDKIANMRNVSQDILRMLGGNREYTKNYGIVHALIRNPRTPQPTAIQLMPRLQERDLKMMLKDKNVSEGVRRHARILMEKRSKKK